MKKVVEIIFPNGEIFEVPADVIATNRTTYYSNEKGKEFINGSNRWVEIYEKSMTEDMLYYWVSKIMEWEELAPYAVKLDRRVVFDYNKLFHDAEFELKDKDKDTTQRW